MLVTGELMKKLILSLTFLAGALCAAAQEKAVRPSLEYDVDFETRFDNREFDAGGKAYCSSMTIFGARLTPMVGLGLEETASGATHRLMAGIDVQKDFGASPVSSLVKGGLAGKARYADGLEAESPYRLNNLALFRDIVLFYDYRRQVRNVGLGITAGIFPRRMTGGEYGEYMFSDSLRFYDPNLEGLLFTFQRPKAYFEVGCDWVGKAGFARRERFMVFTAGYSDLKDWVRVGYAGYMLHYAGSEVVRGVVDNIMVNPYAKFDFGGMAHLQELSVKLGWIQTLQQDRKETTGYIFPCAGELTVGVRNWNVGVRNTLTVGTNLMPYWHDRDNAGVQFGYDLYMGDPFYQITPGSPLTIDSEGVERYDARRGIYDKIDLFYEPDLGDYLKLKVQARFHFTAGGYQGCQQMIGLSFNLSKLMNR